MEEYANAIRDRYLKASRMKKGRMLDEFTRVTGYHRKAAIRLLEGNRRTNGERRRGRPREYTAEIVYALKQAWEVTDPPYERLRRGIQDLGDTASQGPTPFEAPLGLWEDACDTPPSLRDD